MRDFTNIELGLNLSFEFRVEAPPKALAGLGYFCMASKVGAMLRMNAPTSRLQESLSS